MTHAALGPELARAVRALAHRPTSEQTEAAKALFPAAARARRGWTWGRPLVRMRLARLDVPPRQLFIVLESVESVDYRDAKGPRARARGVAYRHVFEAPRPGLAVGEAGDVTRLTRGFYLASAPPPRACTACGPRLGARPELYAAGRTLLEVVGRTVHGQRIAIRMPRGVALAAYAGGNDVHIVRSGAARTRLPPFYLVRGQSRYRPSAAGLIG